MLFEMIRVAIHSLFVNTLRSLLTMLGIIIGVCAVITLMSFGQALESMVTQELENLGTNQIYVYGQAVPNSTSNRALPAQLTNEDVAAIQDPKRVPAAAGVAPEFSGDATVSVNRKTLNTMVVGVTPAFLRVRNSKTHSGQFIDRNHMQEYARVAVLGSRVAQEAFPDSDPIGQQILINGAPFEVIGIMEAKGGFLSLSIDDQIFVPLSTAQTRLFNREPGVDLSYLTIQAQDEQSIDILMQQVENVLREQHRLLDEPNNFNISTQKELIGSFTAITTGITIFLSSIAAISLLVGGIGIMNIMLVSVTERTREIGLRKAVGAKRRDIRMQFLIEALLLSLSGGLLGIGLGFVLRDVAMVLVKHIAPALTLSMAVQPSSIGLAMTFSASIGVFFGLYPAIRASNLSPIDALRYE